MIDGERSGSDKFSTAFPDKSNWELVDHCAYAIFHIAVRTLVTCDTTLLEGYQDNYHTQKLQAQESRVFKDLHKQEENKYKALELRVIEPCMEPTL